MALRRSNLPCRALLVDFLPMPKSLLKACQHTLLPGENMRMLPEHRNYELPRSPMHHGPHIFYTMWWGKACFEEGTLDAPLNPGADALLTRCLWIFILTDRLLIHCVQDPMPLRGCQTCVPPSTHTVQKSQCELSVALQPASANTRTQNTSHPVLRSPPLLVRRQRALKLLGPIELHAADGQVNDRTMLINISLGARASFFVAHALITLRNMLPFAFLVMLPTRLHPPIMFVVG